MEISAQGKFRGPDFTPVTFQLRTVTHERLKDAKDRLIPTVVASPLSERGQEEIADAQRHREDELLAALADPANGSASQADLARACGWFMGDGQPYKVLVGRVCRVLEKEKLVSKERGRFVLTSKGEKAAEEAVTTKRRF